MHTQAFQLDREQRQPLADVVVELPGDTAPLSLLRRDEATAEVAQRCLGLLPVRHIQRRIDVSLDPAAEAAPRHAGIADPAVFAVAPPEAVLDVQRRTFSGS